MKQIPINIYVNDTNCDWVKDALTAFEEIFTFDNKQFNINFVFDDAALLSNQEIIESPPQNLKVTNSTLNDLLPNLINSCDIAIFTPVDD